MDEILLALFNRNIVHFEINVTKGGQSIDVATPDVPGFKLVSGNGATIFFAFLDLYKRVNEVCPPPYINRM